MKDVFLEKILGLVLCLLVVPAWAQDGETQRLFDSHLHYGGEDVKHFSPKQVVEIFDRNNVKYALVSSTPNSGTEQLYHYAPNRIIPFLGLYQTLADKRDWMFDDSVIPRVEQALKSGILVRPEFSSHFFDSQNTAFQTLLAKYGHDRYAAV